MTPLAGSTAIDGIVEVLARHLPGEHDQSDHGDRFGVNEASGTLGLDFTSGDYLHSVYADGTYGSLALGLDPAGDVRVAWGDADRPRAVDLGNAELADMADAIGQLVDERDELPDEGSDVSDEDLVDYLPFGSRNEHMVELYGGGMLLVRFDTGDGAGPELLLEPPFAEDGEQADDVGDFLAAVTEILDAADGEGLAGADDEVIGDRSGLRRIPADWLLALTAAVFADEPDGDAGQPAQTGAMIALVPTEADAQRLAVLGGEPVDQLHLTVWYLGEAAAIPEETRAGLVTAIRSMAQRRELPAVAARGFGANWWNPDGDQPAWVLAVGDLPDGERPEGQDRLAVYRSMMDEAWHDGMVPLDLPVQHTPWAPHVCLAYSTDPTLLEQVAARVGPVTFDRIRIAFAGQHVDVPLSPTSGAKARTAARFDPGQPRDEEGKWTDGVAASAGRWHHNLEDLKDLVEAVESGPGRAQVLTGGASADKVERVTYRDGTVAVAKTVREFEHRGRMVAPQADAEQLVSLVGRIIDAPVPRVLRASRSHLVMDFVDGDLAAIRQEAMEPVDWYDLTGKLSESADGMRLGLLDLLTQNTDRNSGNWVIRDDSSVSGFDHGNAFGFTVDRDPARAPQDRLSPLSRHFVSYVDDDDVSEYRWLPNRLTAADVAWLRDRLDDVRPDFDALSRGDWWQFMADRLEAIGRHAHGEANLFAGTTSIRVQEHGLTRLLPVDPFQSAAATADAVVFAAADSGIALGTMTLDGEAIATTGHLPAELVAARRADGMSPADIYALYAAGWSNGYVVSQPAQT